MTTTRLLIGLTAAFFLGSAVSVAQTFTSVLQNINATAWGDYNNDGFPDLFGKELWTNNQNGTFTMTTPFTAGFDQASGARSLGDYNNDGWLDVLAYVPGETDPAMTGNAGPQLYMNNSGTEWVRKAAPDASIFGPLRGATGLFPVTHAHVNRDISWTDLTGDGYLDVYVSAWNEPFGGARDQDVIYTSTTGTSFTHTWASLTARYGRGITTVDYDRDGDQDIAVANYFMDNNFLWKNNNFNGSTGLSDVRNGTGIPGSGHSLGATAGDFNNDGEFDLIFTNLDHPPNPAPADPLSTINWNNGAPSYNFTPQTFTQIGIPAATWAAAIPGDFDNDGHKDLFLTIAAGSGGSDKPRLYRNNGNNTFSDVTTMYGLDNLSAGDLGRDDAAWADFNGDGFLDLLADGQVWANPGSAAFTNAHYLKVKLNGGQGPNGLVNKSAIGAQVRITDPTLGTITRQISGGVGQGSQNDLVLHFGLGNRTTPVDLEISWPDGSTQTVTGVSVDQLVHVNIDPNEPDLLSNIAGFKWSDENNNSVWDIGEPGLNGWTIYLDANNDNLLNNPTSGDDVCDEFATEDCTVTANRSSNDGGYAFGDLPAGDYTVREVAAGDYKQTFPSPTPPGEHNLTLLAGQNSLGLFGATQAPNFGNFLPAEIHGFKWNDRNNDGQWNANEPGLNGMAVYVDANNDDILNNSTSGDGICDTFAEETCTITANNGNHDGAFSLTGIFSGNSTVREVTEGDMVQTFPQSPDEHTVSLTAGQSVSGTYGVAEPTNFGNVDPNDPVREWLVDTFGAFSDDSNWSFAGAPDSNDHTSLFGPAISQARPIFFEGDITLGRVVFDNSQTYALGGLGAVSLAANSQSVTPSINVLQGSHEFQLTVNLLADTTVDVATGATLSLNGVLNLNGFTLTKTGGGSLLINNHITPHGGSINSPLGGTIGGEGYASFLIPEPATVMMITTACIALFCCRWRNTLPAII